ncbi:hypothetical protein NQ314_014165 [Rhamnusium bicolor]|uniref:EB domain-containing protein n=1 Tax=Rhamnusium bicolor TaxID=1586634 RepID=A0AAV8X450_9CUCU|nr:hypothetical protein NQ314_014165 [Rhamnusium bicolor]
MGHVSFSQLGQHCKNNGECSFVAFSECRNSKCTCIEKYVASTRGSRCLLVAKEVRSPCVDDAQCTRQLGGASGCMDGFCECKEMYQLKNDTNKCVRDMRK